jgi:hypothetical protein
VGNKNSIKSVSREVKLIDNIHHPLKRIARVVLIVGAICSIFLTLIAGRNNDSRVLQALFISWVLSPFVASFLADIRSKSWSVLSSVILQCMILLLTLGSLAFYSNEILNPSSMKPHAFIFIVVPLVSWALIIVVVSLIVLINRRSSR